MDLKKKKKIKKKVQPGFPGKVDQCAKLEMCRRDAAENADLRASSVMLTACLGSEPGTLRESGNCCRNLPWMRPCPCVSAEGRRHGGTGRERARKSDPRVKNGRFLTQYASHFPHLGLKLGYNYTPTMLLYS